MRAVFLTIVAFISALGISNAQILGDTDWETEEDFRNVETQILDNILWLEENPFATETNDTKAISQYVLDWLTETPYVSVTFEEIFTSSFTSNKKYKYGDKFTITYLFGKSAFVIQNPQNESEVQASLRGVIGMIKVYEELLKSDLKAYHRTMEMYRDLNERGSLESYVEEQLESRGMGS